MIKGWSLDNQYILKIIITYKGLSIALSLEYILNKYKYNKGLFWWIYLLKIKSVPMIIEGSIFIDYILTVIFVWLINNKYIVDQITT